MPLRNVSLSFLFCCLFASPSGCGRPTAFSSAGDGDSPAADNPAVSRFQPPDISGSSTSSSAAPPERHSGAASADPSGTAGNSDWMQWRGPTGRGIAAADQSIPTTWSTAEHVIWRTPVPGRGHASPTVVGRHIILTTANRKLQVQSVVAFDRDSGRQVWKTDVNRGGFPDRIHNKNTHATPSVASNGKQLFACFANHDQIQVTALDLNGNQLWQRAAGPFLPRRYGYGYAASPTLYGTSVIVAADFDDKHGTGGYLVALDQSSGQEQWRTPRPVEESYSSPIVATTGGRDQLVISGCKVVAAFDPRNGQQFWSTPATTSATCGTVVWNDHLLFASGGYPKAETAALDSRTGQIVWRNSQKCYEQSLLCAAGFLYGVTDKGIAYCWAADDGAEQWKGRLRGPISASPVLSRNLIYQSNERGETFVFKASPSAFELLATNRLGDEAFASPTICGNRIYLRVADSSGGRRQETLYCIGN